MPHIIPMRRYAVKHLGVNRMNQTKAEDMVARLLSNAAGLKYGSVSVCVKLYDGQVAQVLYSTTENTIAPIQKSDEEK
jgi:hypothetical protein